jgi:hypothetical protein
MLERRKLDLQDAIIMQVPPYELHAPEPSSEVDIST